MTTTNKVTGVTLTDAQLWSERTSAIARGDEDMIRITRVALFCERSMRIGPRLSMTRAEARDAIADVINARTPTPFVLVHHRLILHAAHYLYDHPGKGHDLEQWTIESDQQPDLLQLAALGVPSDARYHCGHVVAGRQRWTYDARRAMSAGTCDRCLPSGGAR